MLRQRRKRRKGEEGRRGNGNACPSVAEIAGEPYTRICAKESFMQHGNFMNYGGNPLSLIRLLVFRLNWTTVSSIPTRFQVMCEEMGHHLLRFRICLQYHASCKSPGPPFAKTFKYLTLRVRKPAPLFVWQVSSVKKCHALKANACEQVQAHCPKKLTTPVEMSQTTHDLIVSESTFKQKSRSALLANQEYT